METVDYRCNQCGGEFHGKPGLHMPKRNMFFCPNCHKKNTAKSATKKGMEQKHRLSERGLITSSMFLDMLSENVKHTSKASGPKEILKYLNSVGLSVVDTVLHGRGIAFLVDKKEAEKIANKINFESDEKTKNDHVFINYKDPDIVEAVVYLYEALGMSGSEKLSKLLK